jgi:hypothetical protein
LQESPGIPEKIPGKGMPIKETLAAVLPERMEFKKVLHKA